MFPAISLTPFQSIFHNLTGHLSKLRLPCFSPAENCPLNGQDKAETLEHRALGSSHPDTSPAPLLLVPSVPVLPSHSSPSPYTWTISSRQLVILGTGYMLISNWGFLAHPCPLCLWRPPHSPCLAVTDALGMGGSDDISEKRVLSSQAVSCPCLPITDFHT